jgi:hypothetical protein
VDRIGLCWYLALCLTAWKVGGLVWVLVGKDWGWAVVDVVDRAWGWGRDRGLGLVWGLVWVLGLGLDLGGDRGLVWVLVWVLGWEWVLGLAWGLGSRESLGWVLGLVRAWAMGLVLVLGSVLAAGEAAEKMALGRSRLGGLEATGVFLLDLVLGVGPCLVPLCEYF